MRIVDARWTPTVNKYVIACRCGKRFTHSANQWRVRCPKCKKRMPLKVLRGRIRKGDLE